MSKTPVPAPLQTCREARSLGLYQKCLSEAEDVPEGSERRYVWLNLDIDMLELRIDDIANFVPVAESVTRIKFAGTFFKSFRIHGIFRSFPNLKEAHLCCLRGAFTLGSWFFAAHLVANLRSREDIRLLNMKTGRWYTAREIDEIYDRRIREARERRAGTDGANNGVQEGDDDSGAFHLDPRVIEKLWEISPRYREESAHA